MSRTKIPTKWPVPDGWVLTWYPPFQLIGHKGEGDREPINVYDDSEPFVPVPLPGGMTGYSPNTYPARLDQFGGIHPGVYALNVIGDHPKPEDLHPDALQLYGKAT